MEIQEIVDLHDKLAVRIKQFESHLGIYPPVEVSNELRYALRAVIEVLSFQNAEPKPEDLEHAMQKSYHALLCAYHDLVDGLTIHISLSLNELRSKYLEESIVVLGERRREIIEFLNEVDAKIADSRGKPKDRQTIYSEDLYDNYFAKLLEYRKLLSGTIIEDVVKLYLTNQAKSKKERNRYIAGIAIAILGIIISIVSLNV